MPISGSGKNGGPLKENDEYLGKTAERQYDLGEKKGSRITLERIPQDKVGRENLAKKEKECLREDKKRSFQEKISEIGEAKSFWEGTKCNGFSIKKRRRYPS